MYKTYLFDEGRGTYFLLFLTMFYRTFDTRRERYDICMHLVGKLCSMMFNVAFFLWLRFLNISNEANELPCN